MKKIQCLLLAILLSAYATAAAAGSTAATAQPTSSRVLINGKDIAFNAYNISGSNYFMLRDLAFTLSGTAKQFSVGWDGSKNAITLTSGRPYTSVGGEMTGKGTGSKPATPTSSKIYLDGKEVSFTAFNIEGNNYFKLRDIGQAFDFGIGWDAASNTISVDTNKRYEPEVTQTKRLPQIDSSTARIPITNAIYNLFINKHGYDKNSPAPLASKTHEAWLNLADKKADIIFLVAPTKDELNYFTNKNVDIDMKIYGFDGLVFMGNKSNPVQNLTSNQIRDIYSKKITNWKTLGGKDAAIDAFIRNKESGSQRLFESLVWEGFNMPNFSALSIQESMFGMFDDMGDVTMGVLEHPNGIGFNIMSYLDSNFANSPLKLFSVDGAAPTTANFASGSYPFLTTSYVAIRADEPAGSPARQLYNWVGSEESKTLFKENSTLTVSFSDSVIIRTTKSKINTGI